MTAVTTFESYITQDGDMVDLISYRRFGDGSATSAIFDVNPVLAAYGPVLPRGLTLRIPVPGVPDRAEPLRLWSE